MNLSFMDADIALTQSVDVKIESSPTTSMFPLLYMTLLYSNALVYL